MYDRLRRLAIGPQILFSLAILCCVFFLVFLYIALSLASSGPGSDGNVTCNDLPMSQNDTCMHYGTSVGDYSYDQQAQYQAHARAVAAQSAQNAGIAAGITGVLAVLFLVWAFMLMNPRRRKEALASHKQALPPNPNLAGAQPGQEKAPWDLVKQSGDLKYNLTITLAEAAQGCQKEVLVTQELACAVCQGTRAEPGTRLDTCPACKGAGEVRSVQQSPFGNFSTIMPCKRCHGAGHLIKEQCHACQGKGRQEKQKRLLVTIPAGVKDGTQVRITGQGHAGWGKGAPGNLYVILKVQ